MQGFGTLDTTVGDIYTATSELNHRLENLSVQHEKSKQSSFLINCYLSFYRKGGCLELDKLWESGKSIDRRHCANVIRQLQTLALKIDFKNNSKDKNVIAKYQDLSQNADSARDGIDKFAEKLERDLLNDFDNAYRSADLAAMKDSTDILTDFNGGSSVIQMFVNQHDYFIVREKLVDTSTVDNEEMWEKLSDPEGDSVELDNAMQVLIDEIKQVIVTEIEIIKKVFRNSVGILKVFLQRVFAQRIQQQVETYLTTAESKSTLLAYMRVLHLCYSKVGSLTKALKEVFAQDNIDEEGELASLLDQSFADIFVPYIENGRYFDTEVKSLGQVITGTLAKFTEAHLASAQKAQREHSILSRFTSHNSGNTGQSFYSLGSNSNSSHNLTKSDSFSVPGDRPGTPGSEKGASQGRIGQFMRAVRLERSNTSQSSKQGNEYGGDENDVRNSTELEPDVTLEHIQKILKYAAESIKRDLELAEPLQIPHDANTFLRILLESLGHEVIDLLLDEALTMSTTQEVKHPIDLSFLKALRQVSSFVYLISSMVRTVIAPMLSSNAVLKQHTITAQNAYLEKWETKMNNITQSAIDLCLGRLNFLLAKQKKKDFIPKTTASNSPSAVTSTSAGFQNDLLDVQPTPTCIEVSHVLDSIHMSCALSLDGENLEEFLQEIGTGFKDLLLDHYKRYNVNVPGGFIVSKDIQRYQECIDVWSVSDLSETFSILHNIANLFTVQ